MNTYGILELKNQVCHSSQTKITNYFCLHTISFNIVTTRKFSKDCVIMEVQPLQLGTYYQSWLQAYFKTLCLLRSSTTVLLNLNAQDYKCLSFFRFQNIFVEFNVKYGKVENLNANNKRFLSAQRFKFWIRCPKCMINQISCIKSRVIFTEKILTNITTTKSQICLMGSWLIFTVNLTVFRRNKETDFRLIGEELFPGWLI